ncbi:transcription antitermination factor NusB [Porphyromonas loveana]|uniref:transcription antitermination factor NusB n=1 Tax=Porphyromonas loveana TaxID=1884669 RepID=UPI0035A1C7B9
MINRALVRSRVLQQAYVYYHRDDADIQSTEKELQNSLERTYDLYLFHLLLIPELTRLHAEFLESKKKKRLATAEDKNPNLRMAENRLAAKIDSCRPLWIRAEENVLNWRNEEAFLRRLLKKVHASDLFARYMAQDAPDSFEADRQFWIEMMRDIVMPDEELAEVMEAVSVFWDNETQLIEKIETEDQPDIEDVEQSVQQAQAEGNYQIVPQDNAPTEIVKEFVLKTIRHIDAETDPESILIPIYKEKDDASFGVALLHQTIIHDAEYKQIIHDNLINWEVERIADMDMLIMQMAITELLHFPNIPALVTINEYIELSKLFSTPKSGTFVNGLLDAVTKKFREQGKLLK